MSNSLVLYLKNSDDSMCAAWIYSTYVDNYSEFMPVQRKEPPPNVQNRDVVLLDFSYAHGVLKMMQQQAQSLLVIAHDNEQDADNLFGLDGVHFDSTKSAARLTWEQLVDPSVNPVNPAHYPSQRRVEPPWLMDCIDDWEVKRDLRSCQVNAALASYEREFHVWDEIADRGLDALIAEGETLLRMRNVHIRAACNPELVGYVTIEPYGITVPCVCVNGEVLVPEIAEALVLISGYRMGGCFFYKPDGTVHYHVIANNRDIDCKRIADHYKGESSQFTADFTLDKPLPFTKWS